MKLGKSEFSEEQNGIVFRLEKIQHHGKRQKFKKDCKERGYKDREGKESREAG